MGVSEITHVNIVAQTGAVGGWIILAEHLQRIAANRRLNCPRNDVDFGRVILANGAVRVRTSSIEVAQRDPAEAVRPLDVFERTLDRQLRFAVGVDRPLLSNPLRYLFTRLYSRV